MGTTAGSLRNIAALIIVNINKIGIDGLIWEDKTNSSSECSWKFSEFPPSVLDLIFAGLTEALRLPIEIRKMRLQKHKVYTRNFNDGFMPHLSKPHVFYAFSE